MKSIVAWELPAVTELTVGSPGSAALATVPKSDSAAAFVDAM